MQTFPLSPVDYIFTGVGSQPVTFAFAYPTKLEPHLLEKNLRVALEHFPLLSSQLQPTNVNDYVYRLGDDGLRFEVIESPLAFDPARHIEEFIEPVNSVVGQPLTKITLTQMPNGSVLAVSISHALVDGFSYFHFLSSWARLSRGERMLEPSLDRSLFVNLRAPVSKTITAADILNDCGLFYGTKRSKLQSGPIKMTRTMFPAETIKSQLAAIKNTSASSFTENDVITARLWKDSLPFWKKDAVNPKIYLTCPFDFRRVLANFPKNYFGCALGFATAVIDFQHLVPASLAELALLIKNAVSKLKADYILNALNTLENLRQQAGLSAMEAVHLRHPEFGMIVTNLTRLPIQGLDFGAGAPGTILTYVEIQGGAAILPAGDGVEVLFVPPAGNG